MAHQRAHPYNRPVRHPRQPRCEIELCSDAEAQVPRTLRPLPAVTYYPPTRPRAPRQKDPWEDYGSPFRGGDCCVARTKAGKGCTKRRMLGEIYCRQHKKIKDKERRQEHRRWCQQQRQQAAMAAAQQAAMAAAQQAAMAAAMAAWPPFGPPLQAAMIRRTRAAGG